MSARTKGNERERMAQSIIESWGWRVERAWPDRRPVGPGRFFSFSHDFFGVGDLLALAPDRLVIVQVCGESGRSERRKRMEAFDRGLTCNYIECQVWTWRGGRMTSRDRLPRQVFMRELLARSGESAGGSLWRALEPVGPPASPAVL